MNKEEMMSKIVEMECEINHLKKELNKQEEPKKGRWKPKLEDLYYFIDNTGRIICAHWDGCLIDGRRYAIGNVFETEEEAQFAVEQLKVLAELKEYADDDTEWKKGDTHWCIEYDTDDRCMYADAYNYIMKVPSKLYFSSNEQTEKAIDAIGEDRLEKYYFCVENDENTSNFSEACKQACMEADSHS